jgi:NAD(P)-dependent dehydrogenase (short-subunit alcohol dehydrogenase family)
MAGRLRGKIALITGAGGGIGSETARLFAREGATVIVNDLDKTATHAVAESIRKDGGAATEAVADISDSAAVRGMFEKAVRKHGGIDVLVNNAFANFRDVTLVDLAEADWDRTLNVCLKGPFLCCQQALPLMRERGGGSIIWVSSVNALFGFGETAYTAAKGGLISLARLVAAEYGTWKVRSNVICPGTIATDVGMRYWQQFPAGFAKLKEMYPMGHIGTPVDVAYSALYLASEESAFVTGAVHVLDGGLLAGRQLELS